MRSASSRAGEAGAGGGAIFFGQKMMAKTIKRMGNARSPRNDVVSFPRLMLH